MIIDNEKNLQMELYAEELKDELNYTISGAVYPQACAACFGTYASFGGCFGTVGSFGTAG
ncbi:hypothetical protein E8L90_19420 [Brevibacillus antibioticus]|uniref:Thiocillin family RiPP n=1 Tax=Brevibacillus antibioticus TaxID=2570228 RepID=A0A4U2Y9W2_9BACL|nr:hypothetical protein [Brevibacillus antibioticus]TKI57449.1 hypothetical protein E8L90_19420 [Brevibacillus antibioticus]